MNTPGTQKASWNLSRLPLIVAPMLGISTPEMVAAACNQGALGALPLGLKTRREAEHLIRQTRSKTDLPFSVNLFCHPEPVWDFAPYQEAVDWLRGYYRKFNLPFPEIPASSPYGNYRDLIELILQAPIHAVSFTFGLPDPDIMQVLQRKGIKMLGTATHLQEALAIAASGMDYVILQGNESGGHRGGFLDSPEPHPDSRSLLEALRDQLPIPVISAGGIATPAEVEARLCRGAAAVQVGSAFLRAAESQAAAFQQACLAELEGQAPVTTTAWSGKLAKGMPSEFVREQEASGIKLPPYPLFNYLTGNLRRYATELGRREFLFQWSGDQGFQARSAPTASIIDYLVPPALETTWS